MNKIIPLCLLLGSLAVQQIVAEPQSPPQNKNKPLPTGPTRSGPSAPTGGSLTSSAPPGGSLTSSAQPTAQVSAPAAPRNELQKCLDETSNILCELKRNKTQEIKDILDRELENLNNSRKDATDPKGISFEVSNSKTCTTCLQRAIQSSNYAFAIVEIGYTRCVDEYWVDFSSISDPTYKTGGEILQAVGRIVLGCCNTTYMTNCDGKNTSCIQACEDVKTRIQCSVDDLEASFHSCILSVKNDLRKYLSEIREEYKECTLQNEERELCLEMHQYVRKPYEEKHRQNCQLSSRFGDQDCQCSTSGSRFDLAQSRRLDRSFSSHPFPCFVG